LIEGLFLFPIRDGQPGRRSAFCWLSPLWRLVFFLGMDRRRGLPDWRLVPSPLIMRALSQ